MKPIWFEGDRLTNKAFRRRPEDTDGLSVASSHEAAKLLQKRSGKGVASLEIRSIEMLALTVFRENDDHGYIQGIPDETTENYDIVMAIADKLLKLSTVTIDPWRRRD